MAASMNGTIKRLVSDKGFGFILADDGNEYFFHNSACQGTRFDELREGQAVTFEKGQGPKGPRGENVRVEELTKPAFAGCDLQGQRSDDHVEHTFHKEAPSGEPLDRAETVHGFMR